MNLGTAQVIRGDARHLPLADDSVDLVVSSPPYWSLRSYQDAGEHYAEQIGSEATPAEFVDALIEVTRELVRVTKPSGSIWINLGDKYNAYNGGRGQGTIQRNEVRQEAPRGTGLDVKNVRAKSLIGLPWRYALRCIDDLGLILRAEVIWSKPNGLPESVTDRVRRSHEQWFHLVLNPRYYSAVDEIREAHAHPHDQAARGDGGSYKWHQNIGRADHMNGHPLGKLPGSVWTVPTEPLRVPDHLGINHFAAFPTEWPRRIIQGWSPSGVCVECGEGRRPVGRAEITGDRGGRQFNPSSGNVGVLGKERIYEITGYACACDPDAHGPAAGSTTAACKCGREFKTWRAQGIHERAARKPAPTTPAVVLDPFGGTGTTALVAKALGRHGISVDMSADYCRLAQWRTGDRNQLAKVLGVAKVEAPAADQLDLFGEIA